MRLHLYPKYGHLIIARKDGRIPYKDNSKSNIVIYFHFYITLIKLINKRGDWEPEEDRKILEFVLQYGAKWSLISKSVLHDRTEHNIKNRFFSLISTFSGVPVKSVIKERKKYIDEEYVKEVLMFYISKNEKRNEGFKHRQKGEDCFFQLKNGNHFIKNSQIEQPCLGNKPECFGLLIDFLEGTLK